MTPVCDQRSTSGLFPDPGLSMIGIVKKYKEGDFAVTLFVEKER